MQPYFRDAVRSDIPAIATILRAASPFDEPCGIGAEEAYRAALVDIDRTDGNYVLVAEYDNQIGAVLQLLCYRQLHRGGTRTAEIVGLYVAPSFRTTGIGGLLLDHAVERVRDLGCRRLQVAASTARRDEHPFWERAGFIHLDRGYVRSVA